MSPCVMLVILVPKKDGTWRMCTDCIPINNITVRYRHLIPCLDDLLDESHGSQMFSKIDLKSRYHQIRVVVYVDDILIYSTCLNDHLLHIRSVLEILGNENLFANIEKCIFCSNEVVVLGFVVGSHGVKVDREKVKAISEWLMPKTVGEVRSFHGLTSFYRRFVKDFNSLIAPSNDVVKNVGFKWEKAQEKAFQGLKERLTQAPILTLPNFSKSFELECNTSRVGIGVVLLQERHPIAYFSEKMKDYVILPKEFVIHSDHEALQHLIGQGKLNKDMLNRHTQGELNVVTNVLSMRHTLIDMLETKMLVIVCTNELIKQLPVNKAYKGGLMGHIRKLKTFDVLSEHFFWPHMRKDVHDVCEKCLTCKVAKSKVSPHGLYASLPIPTTLWIDISMGFMLGLPRYKRGKDSIFVVVGKF
ncbi:Tf2-6, partial [Mucuna pruriens]